MDNFYTYLLVLFNALIVANLFWFLSYLGKYTYGAESNTNKREVFECGFESSSKTPPQIYHKNTMAFVFLIVYEVEFLILLPISFNMLTSVVLSPTITASALAVIMYTCLVVVESGIIEYDN